VATASSPGPLNATTPPSSVPSAPMVGVPPASIVPVPRNDELSVTLVKFAVAGCNVPLLSVIDSVVSVAPDRLASNGVPAGMAMLLPATDGAPEDQLAPVFQSLLTVPIQVSVPPAAWTVTGTSSSVSTPAWFHTS
jgi:hypothetical protein